MIPAFGLLLLAAVNKYTNYLRSRIFSWNIGSVGKGFVVYKGFSYRHPKRIHIGNSVFIDKRVTFSTDNGSSNIFVGDDVSISPDCFIDFTGGISIKRGAHIAFGVYITTHTHGYNHNNPPIGKSLEIGEHAFIGARSSVLYNCNRIGKHAVIGVSSVVTKDVPDYAVVAGNPARIIRYVQKADTD